ncbi:MAG: HTH domain-containing protein [Clostridia bacterium]|nr:HTH domain-containing protein [Clostridia bacterium]
MTANDRRLSILYVLLERRKENIGNLAIEFNVSVSTIMRDVQELSRSHPIITKQGGGGGIEVMDGYHLGMRYMTSEQTALLEKLSDSLTGDELLVMQSILKTFSKHRK